jgi:hypothetical protein
MAVNGIQTNGACQIAIGTGVASHDNGRAGLSVNGTSVVTVTIDTGDTAATFNDNGAHGIYVGGSGSLTITGTAASTAVTQGNGNAGLLIMQTPGGTGAASVTSFTASGTTNGNGITIYGGSSLTLRDSITQGNSADGVLVATYQQGTTTSSDVSLIDLGTPASYGGNTFQFKTGESPNLGTGICLQVGPNAGQNLHAAGNIFEDKDCAITPAILQKSALCADATDYGIADPGTTHPNAIDLAQCGCLATGKNCTESSSCCSESCDARGSTCDSCMGAGLSCAKGSDCCSGTCDGNGACDSCIAVTYTCGQNSDCCSGNCQDHTCEA